MSSYSLSRTSSLPSPADRLNNAPSFFFTILIHPNAILLFFSYPSSRRSIFTLHQAIISHLFPCSTSASVEHSLTPFQPRRRSPASPTGGGGRIRMTTGNQLDGLRHNAPQLSAPSAGACGARRSAVGTSVGRGVGSAWAWVSCSFGS